MIRRAPITLVFAITALMYSRQAWAISSGAVHGRFVYYENQGNFCPPVRDCTDAKYLESQWHTFLGVSQAKIYIRNSSTDALIGQGSTDLNGYFTVTWLSATYPVNATIRIATEHKDGRFKAVRFTDGTSFQIAGPTSLPLVQGTTTTSPQEVGDWHIGSAASPNVHFNIYSGAFRTWNNTLRYSNLMLNTFNNIRIRLFDSSSCGGGCSLPDQIILSAGTEYRAQSAIMHEMGHVAALRANPHTKLWDFSYDGVSGWGFQSQEYRADSFEEGFASFFADASLYWANNPQPYTCSTNFACTLDHRLETRVCGTGADRWPLSYMKLMRDYYDTTNETLPGIGNDVAQASIAQIFDVYASIPQGLGNHQIDEPWSDAARTIPDSKDGRSASDWVYAFDTYFSTNTSQLMDINCNVQ